MALAFSANNSSLHVYASVNPEKETRISEIFGGKNVRLNSDNNGSICSSTPLIESKIEFAG